MKSSESDLLKLKLDSSPETSGRTDEAKRNKLETICIAKQIKLSPAIKFWAIGF